VLRAELGQRAELAAVDYLFASGFELLARNLRLGHLELDIVARKGPLVVVTEVRTRGAGAFTGPFASVNGVKRARLRTAVGRLWRNRLSGMKGVERVRIDVAAVSFSGSETWIDYAEGVIS
jgi:putative endonuclease